MSTHPQAGQVASAEQLVNICQLVTSYYELQPDVAQASQQVSFGTSGHRGSALAHSFNEAHILAITQAMVEYRQQAGIEGPVFVGKDTHALSEPAFASVVQVLVANGVQIYIQQGLGYTPTPVISHAILCYNKASTQQADGLVITPSHNPPQDGGIKYNPPHGGPADTDVTNAIQQRANELINAGLNGVKRIDFAQAIASPLCQQYDYITPYVDDLENVVD
ncbi:MAG: phosphoglucomutase, alpha-D-glucose phosphate-specific, partial [Alkalimonas sp.]|nr:phosphoglucomutase, alpha-D-glucose phosphate-specific [Alkalimonas sp.]